MPLEERFITFNLNEIQNAILIKCIDEKIAKPNQGKITSIRIDKNSEKGDDAVFFTIKHDDEKEEQLEFKHLFLGEALVFYCQGHGIPLPRRGKKILKIEHDKIIMKVITKDEET